MRASLKSVFAATFIANLAGATNAGAADTATLRQGQVQFFQTLAKAAQGASIKAPPAELTASLAAAPALAAAQTAVTTPAVTTPAGTTAFYVSAHPHDFALYTYPYRDVVANNTKVVLIFVTAGDAGLGVGPANAPYYLARESGAIRGVRFMADAEKPQPEAAQTGGRVVNGHWIQTYTYKNTVSYFMRLPDGNPSGGGYPGTGEASLTKLQKGAIATLRAVNGSAVYRGWNDIVTTIGQIVTSEAAKSPNVWLNAHDPEAAYNPGDHLDHVATGALVAAAQARVPCLNATYHVGNALYGVSNLSTEDARNKTATYAAYAVGLADRGYYAWNASTKAVLGGLLGRVAVGKGACAF